MGYNETPTLERIVMEPHRKLSQELANEMIEIINGYYPEFLSDAGFIDSPIARVMFYTHMTKAMMDDTMFPDSQARELVLDELGVKLGVALEDVLRAAKQRFNKS